MWSLGCTFASMLYIYPFQDFYDDITDTGCSRVEELENICSIVGDDDEFDEKTGLLKVENWPELKSSKVFSRMVQVDKTIETDKSNNNFARKKLEKRKIFPQSLSGESLLDNESLSQHLKSGAIDLLSKMLVLNPKKRISVEEALKHPFFSSLFC
jgi:serine/threonine protein kinase